MELLGIYEIARMAGVTPQAVSNWVVRKADFPLPMANLASGPVWDGRDVRVWLAKAGILRDVEKKMHDFRIGTKYALVDIQDAFGGDAMSYLPQLGNRIVCGRFTSDMNPGAPYEILVGEKPTIQRKAELLAAQGGSLPVFHKERPNEWRYCGAMRFIDYVTDGRVVAPNARAAGRKDAVVGMLVFKDPT